MKIIMISIIVTLLCGCGSDIDTVKAAKSPINDIYTIGQLLDGRDACEDIQWEEFEDSKGANIVQYTCNINVSSEVDAYNRKLEETKAKVKKAYEDEIKTYESQIVSIEKTIVLYEDMLTEHVAKFGKLSNPGTRSQVDKRFLLLPGSAGESKETKEAATAYENAYEQTKFREHLVEYHDSIQSLTEYMQGIDFDDKIKNSLNNEKQKMYARTNYKLIAQFAMVDDDPIPRFVYFGSVSELINGSTQDNAIQGNVFFRDMEVDKPVSIRKRF
jgi:hypothetical protein